MRIINLFYRDEKGGGLIEYALIIVLIALAATAAMSTVGEKLSTSLSGIADVLQNLQTTQGS